MEFITPIKKIDIDMPITLITPSTSITYDFDVLKTPIKIPHSIDVPFAPVKIIKSTILDNNKSIEISKINNIITPEKISNNLELSNYQEIYSNNVTTPIKLIEQITPNAPIKKKFKIIC